MSIELQPRLEERAAAWGISVDDIVRTASSLVAFGNRDHHPVVLKVVKCPGDECLAGPVLEAFGGRGVVRILEHADGAVLLERLMPGRRLVHEDVRDEQATAIIADVIGRMSPGQPPSAAPRVESLGKSFERYATSGDCEIPGTLVEAAHRTFVKLCASRSTTRLLHGDLHHHNVLLDSRRGWLAIDPKGVIGELAYEVGAALRNPCDVPGLFTAPATIERRVACFAHVLNLDPSRILAWAFAQAVLAAIWELEDEGVLQAGIGWIALASSIQRLVRFSLSG